LSACCAYCLPSACCVDYAYFVLAAFAVLAVSNYGTLWYVSMELGFKIVYVLFVCLLCHRSYDA
jgi:hypothetical protein